MRGRAEFLDGYESVVALDRPLLERWRALARLRLACIHREGRLLERTEALAAPVR